MKQLPGKNTDLEEQQENELRPMPVLVDDLQIRQLANTDEKSSHKRSLFLRRFLIVTYIFILIIFCVFAAIFYISFLLPSFLPNR